MCLDDFLNQMSPVKIDCFRRICASMEDDLLQPFSAKGISTNFHFWLLRTSSQHGKPMQGLLVPHYFILEFNILRRKFDDYKPIMIQSGMFPNLMSVITSLDSTESENGTGHSVEIVNQNLLTARLVIRVQIGKCPGMGVGVLRDAAWGVTANISLVVLLNIMKP